MIAGGYGNGGIVGLVAAAAVGKEHLIPSSSRRGTAHVRKSTSVADGEAGSAKAGIAGDGGASGVHTLATAADVGAASGAPWRCLTSRQRPTT